MSVAQIAHGYDVTIRSFKLFAKVCFFPPQMKAISVRGKTYFVGILNSTTYVEESYQNHRCDTDLSLVLRKSKLLNLPKSGNLQTKFYVASLVKANHSQNSVHRFYKSVEKIVYNFVHKLTLDY